jgi:hypothetical protein
MIENDNITSVAVSVGTRKKLNDLRMELKIKKVDTLLEKLINDYYEQRK